MATPANTKKVLSVAMLFALVGYVPTRNYRSEPSPKKKMEDLRRSFADSGWWTDKPIPAEKIDEVHAREGAPGEMAKCGPHSGGLMPDFRKDILAERQLLWDNLKVDTSTAGQARLATFVAMYTHEGKKLVKPDFLAVATFQRGSQYFESQVQRYNGDGAAVKGQEPLVEVPVEVCEFGTDQGADLKRLEKQVRENEGHDVGKETTGHRDKLRSAKIFFQRGCIENYFRNLYSSTTGQKVYGLLFLSSLYPELKIYDRLLMPKPEDDATAESSPYIPYEKINTTDLSKMIRRTPAARKKMQAGETAVTMEEVSNWLRDLKKTSGNLDKIMAKPQVEAVMRGNECRIVQDAMKSVLENNTDFAAKYNACSVMLNSAMDIVQTGNLPPLEILMKKVASFMQANPTADLYITFRDAVAELLKPLAE